MTDNGKISQDADEVIKICSESLSHPTQYAFDMAKKLCAEGKLEETLYWTKVAVKINERLHEMAAHRQSAEKLQ